MRFLSLLILCLVPAPPAAAQPDLVLRGRGGVAFPTVDPQRTRFGVGAEGGALLTARFAPVIGIGAGLHGTLLSDGEAPEQEGVEDPGVATLVSLTAHVHLRPLATAGGAAEGLYLDLAGGGSWTGPRVRPAVAAGLGWIFHLGDVGLGPFARWQTVFETSNALERRPAHTLAVGAELTLFDHPPAPPTPRDSDGDGLDDPDDSCPRDPEDADDFQDEDGCPDPDNDDDGVLDESDRCPLTPEDRDGFEDEDGCPDLDDDADGIPDTEDQCRLEPEDRDGFEDEDGCPDPDNDGDGFLDTVDHCPNEAEVVNGHSDDDGCPDQGLIELVNDHIILEETVTFDFNSARLRRTARPVLQEVAELIEQHPEWTHLRVEGHACTLGSHPVNQRLSEDRAEAVRAALVALGVPPDRIDAVGLGETEPRAYGDTEEEHELNRRVEIVVSRGPREPVGDAPDQGADR